MDQKIVDNILSICTICTSLKKERWFIMKPMKLSKKITNIIAEALRKGASIETAYSSGNISRRSYFGWRSQGKSILDKICEDDDIDLDDVDLTKKERMLVYFFWETEKALAEYADTLIEVVHEATPSDWRAAAWILEKRFPEEFGRFSGRR